MKILIVDDLEENIALLAAMLESAGYEVAAARNGREALDFLHEGGVSLIISDIFMPVVDGFRLCRACKSDPLLREIPFIIYTATYTDKKDEELALSFGADRFLVKPQDPADFLRTVQEVLAGLPAPGAGPAREIKNEATHLASYSERLASKLNKKVQEMAELQATLRQREELYRLVMDNAAEAILIVKNGLIIAANRGCERLSGYPKEVLASRHFTNFVHPEDRGLVEERHRRRLAGEEIPAVYPFRIVNASGQVKWVEIHAVLIPWEEGPATLSFLNDVTERRRTEEELARSFANVQKALGGTITAIDKMVEARDPYTAGHQRRVADLAFAIASEMEFSEEQREGLKMAATIHDIGKLSVPTEILCKPMRLTETEMSLIRVHPRTGYEILKGIDFPWPIARIILEHHERLDGSGYPQGLKEDEILAEARVIAIADVVESMASHRPYRPTLGIGAALKEVEKGSGRLYDKEAAAVCLRLFREKGYVLG